MDEKIVEMVNLVNGMNTKNNLKTTDTNAVEVEKTRDAFLVQNRIQEMVQGIRRKV